MGKLYPVVLVLVCAIVYYSSAFRRRQCSRPHGNLGYCMPLVKCIPMENLNKKPNITEDETAYLQQSICGHTPNYKLKICCPPEPEWSLPFEYIPVKFPTDGSQPVTSNPVYTSVVQPITSAPTTEGQTSPKPTPVTQSVVDPVTVPEVSSTSEAVSVQNATEPAIGNGTCVCDTENDTAMICCSSSTESATPVTDGPNTETNRTEEVTSSTTPQASFDDLCPPSVSPPDHTSFCCGIGPNNATMSEDGVVWDSGFPWLVLIQYDDKRELCGGTLISSRFVLTAAHCLQPEISGEPILVHLGDYDRSNPKGDPDFTADVLVESYFSHPLYDRVKHIHDIGLIKLVENTPFTDSIGPICLPTYDVVMRGMKDNHNFAVAGWGSTDVSGSSDVKLFVPVPYSPLDKCQPYHAHTLIPEQICAGGRKGKDSCGGDSGGPLEVYDEETRLYMVAGIVSFGAKNCGTEGNPGVYTHVYKYLDWIFASTTQT